MQRQAEITCGLKRGRKYTRGPVKWTFERFITGEEWFGIEGRDSRGLLFHVRMSPQVAEDFVAYFEGSPPGPPGTKRAYVREESQA